MNSLVTQANDNYSLDENIIKNISIVIQNDILGSTSPNLKNNKEMLRLPFLTRVRFAIGIGKRVEFAKFLGPIETLQNHEEMLLLPLSFTSTESSPQTREITFCIQYDSEDRNTIRDAGQLFLEEILEAIERLTHKEDFNTISSMEKASTVCKLLKNELNVFFRLQKEKKQIGSSLFHVGALKNMEGLRYDLASLFLQHSGGLSEGAIFTNLSQYSHKVIKNSLIEFRRMGYLIVEEEEKKRFWQPKKEIDTINEAYSTYDISFVVFLDVGPDLLATTSPALRKRLVDSPSEVNLNFVMRITFITGIGQSLGTQKVFHGPVGMPESQEDVLVFPLLVEDQDATDERIQKGGRIVNICLHYHTKQKKLVTSNREALQQHFLSMINSIVPNLTFNHLYPHDKAEKFCCELQSKIIRFFQLRAETEQLGPSLYSLAVIKNMPGIRKEIGSILIQNPDGVQFDELLNLLDKKISKEELEEVIEDFTIMGYVTCIEKANQIIISAT